MICKVSADIIEVRTVDSSRRFTIEWEVSPYVVSARMHPTRNVIALVVSRDVDRSKEHGVVRVGNRQILLVDLEAASSTPLDTPDSYEVAWTSEGEQLAYVGLRELGIYDLHGDGAAALKRYRPNEHPPESLAFDPSGKYLCFLRYRSGAYRLETVDTNSGQMWPITARCYSYDWWDGETLIYQTARGFYLADSEGVAQQLLTSTARLAELRSLLADHFSLEGPEQLRQRGTLELGRPNVFGDRIFFWVGICIRGAPRTSRHRAIVSVSRVLTDPQLHFGSGPEPTSLFALLNEGRTLGALYVETDGQYVTQRRWVYAGEHANSIPDGYGPLPRRPAPRGACAILHG